MARNISLNPQESDKWLINELYNRPMTEMRFVSKQTPLSTDSPMRIISEL